MYDKNREEKTVIITIYFSRFDNKRLAMVIKVQLGIG